MARNKKSKLKIILIIIFILIVILVAVLLILLNQSSSEKEEQLTMLEYINGDEWSDDIVYPDYTSALGTAYSGDLSIKSMGKSMYYVVTEVFPEYYEELKNASTTEISEYFEENKGTIYIDLAIENETAFVNLINNLQDLSGNSITWESYRIDMDTIKTGSNYTKAVLYVTYKNNEEIAFNIKVNNKVSSDCSTIVYTVSTD